MVIRNKDKNLLDKGIKMVLSTGLVFELQLARSLGLDRYAEIMRGDPSSPEFQRLFNGYYRIRRNSEWRSAYYALFVQAKENNYSFEKIITFLYEATGNVEASFSSKMLATIDSSKPIWDQYVLQNLGLELTGKTQDEKLQHAILLYGEIVHWYEEYLKTDEAKKNIQEFDRWLPRYSWISEVKKIDCLLWSKR